MKILAIGDFHGTFPKKFEKLIKKQEIDLVVSIGDFFPFIYRDLWFNHCYGKDIELWEVIGKKKLRSLVVKDLKLGERSIKALNKIGVPVISVAGNSDYINYSDVFDIKKGGKHHWDWYNQDFFSKILKKYRNVRRFDYSFVKFGEYVFIGSYGQTFPGKVKSKSYKKHKKILDKMFKKFKHEKIIFVSHNVPYNTRLDKIGEHAHKKARGKHYGSKLIRRTIDKWRPMLSIAGHIHEGRGKQNLGKTLCVNVGSAHEGEACVINLDGKNVKVRFI